MTILLWILEWATWDLDLSDRWGSFLFQDSFIIQFSSVTQSRLTLCTPMDYSTPGFPVHHQLPKLAHTRVFRVTDAIQPSHPVIPISSCLQSFPASGSFPMSQFFASGGQSIGVSASASIFYSLTIESAASSCAVVVIVIVQKSPGNTSVLGIPLWNGLKKNHKVDDISHLYSSPLVISSSIPPSYP